MPLAAVRASPWRHRSWALAGAVCAALLVAAVAIPFVQQSVEADRIEARIEALRPQVELAEALRRRLTDQAASADVVAAEGARVGDALRALADVTDVLPDDTLPLRADFARPDADVQRAVGGGGAG